MSHISEKSNKPTDMHIDNINEAFFNGSGFPSSPFKFPMLSPTIVEYESEDSTKNIQDLSPEMDQLADRLVSIGNNMEQLRCASNSLSDFNESLGSLLMGLNVNAWCVHFENAPNSNTWKQWKELQNVNREIDKYEAKIKNLKQEISGTRTKKMWRHEPSIGRTVAKKRRRIEIVANPNTAVLNTASAFKTTLEEKEGADTISSINDSTLKLNTMQR
ncbi:hypothetical protein HII13_005424 [Brettanomyces bruxellensis]|nr:hypothetical protein HII13_005424 [Brettanomyces bruxellensis]